LGSPIDLAGLPKEETGKQKEETGKQKKRPGRWRIYIFWGGLAVSLILVIGFSIVRQYVPKNDFESRYEFHDMTVLVRRDSAIVIPISSFSNDEFVSHIFVTVYHKPTSDFRVLHVKLSTKSEAILNNNGEFNNTTTSTSRLSSKPLPGIETYDMAIGAQHSLEIKNITSPFTIDIFSLNKTSPISNQTSPISNKTAVYWNLNSMHNFIHSDNKTSPDPVNVTGKTPLSITQVSIPFNWRIKTLDFSQFTYFWIVLVGIIVSRFASKVQGASPTNEITTDDVVWAGISGIIALLIFSNFQTQVSLTSHILPNISLAFAFGFGFDKVLSAIPKK
jgi:hypothetical protein